MRSRYRLVLHVLPLWLLWLFSVVYGSNGRAKPSPSPRLLDLHSLGDNTDLSIDNGGIVVWPKDLERGFSQPDYYEYDSNEWTTTTPRIDTRSEGEFNYQDQNAWPQTCKGNRQSPIDISFSNTKASHLGKVGLNVNYNRVLINPTLKNSGHSAVLEIPKNEQHAILTGPAVAYDFYRVAQLHFHWGRNNSLGSEHSFNGRKYPLEMHIVHFNIKYGTFEKASNQVDGLVVLTVIFQLAPRSAAPLEVIEQHLPMIRCRNQQVSIEQSINLINLLPSQVERVFMYQGSLTTPPCSETVTWYILESTMPVSKRTLEEFRSLYTDNHCKKRLIENWRNIQKIHGREIHRSARKKHHPTPNPYYNYWVNMNGLNGNDLSYK